jgi:hypothetical protein
MSYYRGSGINLGVEQLASRNTSAVGAVHYTYDTDDHLIAEANATVWATTPNKGYISAQDD